MKIRAPAKINLRLRVVGKRWDGYHLIDSILVPVSLYDEIEITKGKAVTSKNSRPRRLDVSCAHPHVPKGRKNLAYQAASLLLQGKGIKHPVKLRIQKRIPVGAGLGGGSSDAAATLVGLNRLLHLKCSLRKLLELASTLGADVPFFIKGRPARARGIGERLTPMVRLPRLWVVILYPGFALSTAWVYRNLRVKLTKSNANTSITSPLRSPADLRRLLVNDLEAVTVARYPRIGWLKQRLIQEGAIGSLMSGSGSSAFGIFPSRQTAKQAFNRLRKVRGVQAFLVRSLN